MFVGLIIAGDGEVEASILFETRTEANDKMDALMRDHYDPTFDRIFISPIQAYDEVVNELVEAKEEEARYQGDQNPTGFIVDARMEDDEGHIRDYPITD
jgi:hypothetical protein